MQRIRIKIDKETLNIIHQALQVVLNVSAQSIEKRVRRSIQMEIFDLFTRRLASVITEDEDKKITITLRYHLATSLFEVLIVISKIKQFGLYERNKSILLANEIHKQLQ